MAVIADTMPPARKLEINLMTAQVSALGHAIRAIVGKRPSTAATTGGICAISGRTRRNVHAGTQISPFGAPPRSRTNRTANAQWVLAHCSRPQAWAVGLPLLETAHAAGLSVRLCSSSSEIASQPLCTGWPTRSLARISGTEGTRSAASRPANKPNRPLIQRVASRPVLGANRGCQRRAEFAVRTSGASAGTRRTVRHSVTPNKR